MPVYTPPALNAVNFSLSRVTVPGLTPYTISLSSYSVPALNAVNFALVLYALPFTFPRVNFELGLLSLLWSRFARVMETLLRR